VARRWINGMVISILDYNDDGSVDQVRYDYSVFLTFLALNFYSRQLYQLLMEALRVLRAMQGSFYLV